MMVSSFNAMTSSGPVVLSSQNRRTAGPEFDRPREKFAAAAALAEPLRDRPRCDVQAKELRESFYGNWTRGTWIQGQRVYQPRFAGEVKLVAQYPK